MGTVLFEAILCKFKEAHQHVAGDLLACWPHLDRWWAVAHDIPRSMSLLICIVDIAHDCSELLVHRQRAHADVDPLRQIGLL